MMHRNAAALLGLLVLLPTPLLAQDRGTEADQEACTPDVFRLCSDYIPNEGQILACLQSKHRQLSAACEPVIFPHASTAETKAPAEMNVSTPHHRHHHRHRHLPPT